VYQVHVNWASELCGSTESNWDEAKRVITTQYYLAALYQERPDAIVTWQYKAFLGVILVLWWTLMMEEVRHLQKWWIALIMFPTDPVPGIPAVTLTEDRAFITFIHPLHKFVTLLFNLLPRTVICFWLSYTGTWFLIEADSYEELIMNGVALGFLIEVDNMLYAAVVSDVGKEMLGKVDPLTVEFIPCCCRRAEVEDFIPTSIPFTMLLCGIVAVFIGYAYTAEHGKIDVAHALECLCHAEGVHCVSAQVLGGHAYLRWSQ
jgi:hypothetical protein